MPLQDDVYLADGGLVNLNGISNGSATTGIGPMGRVQTYDVIPLTLATNNIATSQSPGAAALTLTAGTGTTSVVINGVTYVKLDIPRNISFTSGGVDTGITFNVVGLDQYLVSMHENVTGASSTIARGAKAWQYISSITPSGAVASTIIVGTDDTFGLPYLLTDKTYCLGVQWNNTLAKDTGTLTVGSTSTPSATTGDVRGTYKPSSGASDGTKRLVFTQIISSVQIGTGATAAAVFGKTQF